MHASPAELTLTPGGQRLTHLPPIKWGGVPEYDTVLQGYADGVFHTMVDSAVNDSNNAAVNDSSKD